VEQYSYVYILANKPYGTLYVGVAANLVKRVWEHKNDFVEGFSCENQTHMLVWYEQHGEIIEAITREKRIKKWHRDWKVNLIQSTNPTWRDLYPDIVR
jgi:putative endonuclease